MIVMIKELCLVTYPTESDRGAERATEIERDVVYQSSKNNLLQALKDYDSNYNPENILYSDGDEYYDYEYLGAIEYLSISKVE